MKPWMYEIIKPMPSVKVWTYYIDMSIIWRWTEVAWQWEWEVDMFWVDFMFKNHKEEYFKKV